MKINMEYRKGILFIRIKGELSQKTSKNLIDYLVPLIEDKGIKYIVFNLGKVTYIDKIGKETIKIIIKATTKNYGKGLICNTSVKFDDRYTIDNELMAFQTVSL